MDSRIISTLREILCSSISLDDGLSAIQNVARSVPDDIDLIFEVARAIEEIILRRPGLANIKLTELIVRLSFSEDRTMPELISLLDTRFTNAHRRSETEILPDIDAIPVLLDILGELGSAMSTALRHNLRPLLQFLTDETLLTLEAIYERDHPQSTRLAIHEVHYLTYLLMEEGLFDCAEALLNRVVDIAREMKMDEVAVSTALDLAAVQTELGIHSQARVILQGLERSKVVMDSPELTALVTLQQAINETRDDSVDHTVARALSRKAIQFYSEAISRGKLHPCQLGIAQLTIGSNILANGWREAVPEAIQMLEASLATFESLESRRAEDDLHVYNCLVGLGLAHGLLGDHDNIAISVQYMERAKATLQQVDRTVYDPTPEEAQCDNTLGWICLFTESDEFWSAGVKAFQRAIETRERLLLEGRVSTIELLGSRLGLSLSALRDSRVPVSASLMDQLRDTLAQYMQLFPTDSRALIEIGIALYNVVWLVLRHGVVLPDRLKSLLEDIDGMLEDLDPSHRSPFLSGALLVIPLMNSQWTALRRRAASVASSDSQFSKVGMLMEALALGKLNTQATSPEVAQDVVYPAVSAVAEVDEMLAKYWSGHAILSRTVRQFYHNRNYSELATGLYRAALEFFATDKVSSQLTESSEFIRATSLSIAKVLLRFSTALESHYEAIISEARSSQALDAVSDESDYLLSEDWIGLIKITNAYLQMIEEAEPLRAQPYLNAVFSNLTRALRMMDGVAMVDRRVLAYLGQEMSRRFYLRA
ncbi:MAG: hypothetical protein HXY34_12055 [Candidatus Thorarchaeota archaeon]|nr:hypothetical protein [Candidatus Thorarchaeota archaeon]